MNEESYSSEKYMKLFGWEGNPFVFKILPDLFVGYESEMRSLIENLSNGCKFSLILGPTGSGKTTMMKNVINKIQGYGRVFYVPKPPNDPEGWKKIFTEIVKPGFFRRLFMRSEINNITIYEVGDWINKRSKGNRLLLLVDECHESTRESLEWLRTLTDQIDNLSLVMGGLPVFEKRLMEELETFRRRIENRVELTNLTSAETRELIKRRIEWVGGEDVKPFTSSSVRYIYDRTSGFPREVLRVSNDLVKDAIGKNISSIDTDFLKDIVSEKPSRETMQSVDELPYRQRSILEILSKGDGMTPTQVVKQMDPKEYNDAGNAIRSVNNILRRLMKDKMVIRERKGKAFKYRINPKFQTMFIEA
ncbi:MAG: AAA family ATPase [Candidatus Aenigmarchaeota archaeon]|nr:AAA family ATPase [Candidatus Aenigmarchaeota archaeon]